jgi:pimeloyl-ACP methyl ester carboxylesterase
MTGKFIFLIALIGLAAVLAGAGCTTPADPVPRAQDQSPEAGLPAHYPAPGELVDVNGSRMHIYCTGSGSPTVILEAGSTDASLSWTFVQSNVSQFTCVCSYDRLGYAWSEPLAGPVTVRAVNERLHTLLSRANISPPYIMVGHSLGGEYVRAYAHRYPSDVAGIVLVDPGSEWQMVRTGEQFTAGQSEAITAAVAGLREAERKAADGTFARNLSLVPVDPRLPPGEFHAYQALLASRPYFWESRAVEAESAFSMFGELQRENITSPGSVPLIVISSGNEMGFSPDPEENARANRIFRTLQQEMARQSTRGSYQVAANTSHYVQLDRPDIVTDAIRSVANESRRTMLVEATKYYK